MHKKNKKMKNNKETWAAILLGIVLLLSIGNEFISGKKDNNFEKQIEQDLVLSKLYGETNARWLEMNEMLLRNLAIALEGLWNKTVEESGKFKKERFTAKDWEYWKSKTVGEKWKDSYEKAWRNLRTSIDNTNEKRHKQECFIKKSKFYNYSESILRVLQILFTVLALILYVRVLKDSKYTLDTKNDNNKA